MELQKESDAPALMKSPIGMKVHVGDTVLEFRPAAKAEIGGDDRDDADRSSSVPRKHIHTARQTRALHMMPSVRSKARRPSAALEFAVVRSDKTPTEPPPNL